MRILTVGTMLATYNEWICFQLYYFFFNKLWNHVEKECKRHGLTFEKLQKVRDEWNEHKMKQLDFANKRLRQKNAVIEIIHREKMSIKQFVITTKYFQTSKILTF